MAIGPPDDLRPRGDVRARAFDAAAFLTIVGLLIALAQMSAWRAGFSSAAAIGFAGSVFAFRYLRGRSRLPVSAVLVLIALCSLVTVYLEPVPANAPPAAPAVGASPSPLVLDMDALLAGDCVVGGDLVLDNPDVPWPDSTRVVSCTEPHDGEVFLAGDAWEPDAAFPGDEGIEDDAQRKCRAAFRAYIGIDYERSTLDYTRSSPTADSWESGDRHIYCIAFDPEGQLTGPVRRASR